MPIIIFGQSFDFSDIKKINSENKFKIFALENLYFMPDYVMEDQQKEPLPNHLSYCYKDHEFTEINDFGGLTVFSSSFLTWSREFNLFEMRFSLNNPETKNIFDKIINQIKLECEYYNIYNKGIKSKYLIERVSYYGPDELLCYKCPKSTYKGMITFYSYENFGYIQTVKMKNN